MIASWAEVRPEAGRLWVRYHPRRWPASPRPWVDLVGPGLGSRREGEVPVPPPESLDDVVYLPPVRSEAGSSRDELAVALVERGVPVVVHRLPGDAPAPAGALSVYDPLPELLGEGVGEKAELGTVLWPVLPGVGDSPRWWEVGLDELKARGATTVVPIRCDPAPSDRRRLLELRPDLEPVEVFHGPPGDLRAVTAAVLERGFAAVAPRPPCGDGGVRGRNRRVAAELLLVGELWLRNGGAESAGQTFLRAGRWVDGSPVDVVATAREGNLHVLTALDQRAREIVLDLQTGERSRLRQRLEEELTAR